MILVSLFYTAGNTEHPLRLPVQPVTSILLWSVANSSNFLFFFTRLWDSKF